MLVAVFAGAFLSTGALAATFADACGGPNNLDPAVCERLDYLAQQTDGGSRQLSWILGALACIAVLPILRGLLK